MLIYIRRYFDSGLLINIGLVFNLVLIDLVNAVDIKI